MNWILLTPEMTLLLAAALFLVMACLKPDSRRDYQLAVTMAAFSVAAGIACVTMSGDLFNHVYRVDLFSQVFKALLAIGFFLVVTLCDDFREIAPTHHAEGYFLLAVCTLSMMMLVLCGSPAGDRSRPGIVQLFTLHPGFPAPGQPLGDDYGTALFSDRGQRIGDHALRHGPDLRGYRCGAHRHADPAAARYDGPPHGGYRAAADPGRVLSSSWRSFPSISGHRKPTRGHPTRWRLLLPRSPRWPPWPFCCA
jgi:hypothetical protein